MVEKKAERIQTSILNAGEKKVLVWLAERQPRWMTSDALTYIGTFGAIVIAAGYILSDININFLWLSSLGFVINWYGDSLDGTLARVRKTQRPLYGYYLDHTVDCINEGIMFLGIGLSSLIHLELALLIFIVYLFLTINVSVNAHLKSEFKLTYMSLGPTEFRLIAILLNVALIFIKPLREVNYAVRLLNKDLHISTLDIAGVVIFLLLGIIYLVTIISDAKSYAKIDPLKKPENDATSDN